MREQPKIRDTFLQEIDTLKKKIEEIEGLTEKNGVRYEDLVKRLRKTLVNFWKKMEAIEKMASK